MTPEEIHRRAHLVAQWLEVPVRRVYEMRMVDFHLFWQLMEMTDG